MFTKRRIWPVSSTMRSLIPGKSDSSRSTASLNDCASVFTTSTSFVSFRSGIGIRIDAIVHPRPSTHTRALALDNIALHGVDPHAFRRHPLERSLDLLDRAVHLQYHPTAILRHIGAPHVGHDVELLPQLVDDRERNQLLRKRELHPLLRHDLLLRGRSYAARRRPFAPVCRRVAARLTTYNLSRTASSDRGGGIPRPSPLARLRP